MYNMKLFTKHLFSIVALSLFIFATPTRASEDVDNALIDIIYEAIEGKKIVVLPPEFPATQRLKEKAEELGSEIIFLDWTVFTSLTDDQQNSIYNDIIKLDDTELLLETLINSNSFIPNYVKKYDSKDLALFASLNCYSFDNYVPTIDKFSIYLIERNKLTKDYLNNAVNEFKEFVQRVEEATFSLNNEGDNASPSEVNIAINFSISNFANVLAWNAILLEEYEIAHNLYVLSSKYSNNFSSILNLASLLKEKKINTQNKESIEQALLMVVKEQSENSFYDNAAKVFLNGYIYAPQHYFDLNWNWIIKGIPENSKEYNLYFDKLTPKEKDSLSYNPFPSLINPSKDTTAKLEKLNIPKKITACTPQNLFSIYSILRNRYTKTSEHSKNFLIEHIFNNPDTQNKLKHRLILEKKILDSKTIEIELAADKYLELYGYNRQVAIASLLADTRLISPQKQVPTLDLILNEEGEQAPAWAKMSKKAIEALLNNNLQEFKQFTTEAIVSYKGNDRITLGYLYNNYAFSLLLTKTIDDASNRINVIDLTHNIDIENNYNHKLTEADFLLYAVGNYYLSSGKLEEAKSLLGVAYLKNTISQVYLNDFVVVLMEDGEYIIGRNLLKEHNEKISELSFEALDTLAVCIVRANPNDAEEALKYLRQSEELAKKIGHEKIPPELLLHFAEIYQVLDNQEKATEYFNLFKTSSHDRNFLESDKNVIEKLSRELK